VPFAHAQALNSVSATFHQNHMAEKFIYHIVSETHWDREWYLTFQQFRSRLVQVCDRLLKILDEDPGFRYFTLDGQTIVLEDYLEVRPDARAKMEHYIRGGRILIGPWYVLPDEFLEGAEAMVRNLMLGYRIASNFGAIMKVGYLPDQFGHIGQIPQILRGIGIDNAVVWRGIGEEVDKTEFNWISPDGSSVLAIYLPDGYCNAANLPLDPAKLAAGAKNMGRRLRSMATTMNVLFMNGCDHLEAQAGLPASMRAANEELGDAELVHSTLPMYIAAIKAGNPQLRGVSGEFRSTARAHLLVGVLSTRMWIKQLNNKCEKLLESWAEPLTAWAWLAERKAPQDATFIKRAVAMNWLAWKYLLQNHPHDSICGCSIDEVHRDMVPRFKWAEEICETVIDNDVKVLADHIDTVPKAPTKNGKASAIIVFNPSAGPRTDIAHGRMKAGAASMEFDVVDEKGEKVAVQGVDLIRDERREADLLFVAGNLPGYGYRVYHAIPGDRPLYMPSEAPGDSIENEFYKIVADKGKGTITITNKEDGTTYADCNGFVDVGDAGDEYNFSPPKENIAMDLPRSVSTACEVGPARTTLRIKMVYALPESLSGDRNSRSKTLVEMPITSSISLYPGVRRIDLSTTVENAARDHWLRVYFPTGVEAKMVHSEGHFDVMGRAVGAQSVCNRIERPIGTFPQKSFTDVNDGTRGLLLANKGLPECEALVEGGKVILALTLLRCVGWLSRGDLSYRRGDAGPRVPSPEAQCLGHHVFEYALVPHRGTWEGAFQEAHYLNEPLRVFQVEPRKGELPPELSWIDVKPQLLIVSSIKLAERGNGIVVRVYNPSERLVEGSCSLAFRAQRASFVDLNEDVIAGTTMDQDGNVKLDMKPKAIASVLYEF